MSEPDGPEETLERIEAFLEAGMTANARHQIELFEERYDVSIEELIADDPDLQRLFDSQTEELL